MLVHRLLSPCNSIIESVEGWDEDQSVSPRTVALVLDQVVGWILSAFQNEFHLKALQCLRQIVSSGSSLDAMNGSSP